MMSAPQGPYTACLASASWLASSFGALASIGCAADDPLSGDTTQAWRAVDGGGVERART